MPGTLARRFANLAFGGSPGILWQRKPDGRQGPDVQEITTRGAATAQQGARAWREKTEHS